MRSFSDRVRHAVLFELIGLAIFTPGAALLFDQPMGHMGVIGIVSATAATIWNFVFNLAFDRTMLRLRGSVQKTMAIRVLHTGLFEAGLIVILIPFIAWYLGISLVTALLLDISVVAFYLVYAFVFNIAYDRAFPIETVPLPRASA
ncbi:PACE efflux transporter [Shinella sp.]|uniref:PACE efflux transporter n=1 Tax=Shinella sp. TaxID=1870904 RepID=UPI0039E5CAED